jgi:hypothetical protein
MRTLSYIEESSRAGNAVGETQPKPPTKEEVRAWLQRVIASGNPPPSAAAIRQELWHAPHTGGTKGQS